MKSVAILVVAAIVLAVAGTAAFGVAAFERDMSAVEEHLAVQDYAAAAAKLDDASTYTRYARWVPRLGAQASADIKARRAALQYWQRQYSALLPRDADPVGAVEGEPVELQMLVANGAYRAGQVKAAATDQAKGASKDASMQTLQEAIGGYLTVLKGPVWDERAAYNYEFLVRVREDIAKGKRKELPPPPEEQDGANGEAGAPFEPTNTKAFEVYIPLEEGERNKASEAGKAAPNARKG
jgi:hypothetical protein